MIGAMLQPEVIQRQELTVSAVIPTLAGMGAPELAAFAQRLNELCDEVGIPPKGKARQSSLAKLFGVTQNGARKWLEGEGFPSQQKAMEICRTWKIAYEWFMTGRGPKYVTVTRPSRKLEAAYKLMQQMPEYKLDEAIKILAVLTEHQKKAGGER